MHIGAIYKLCVTQFPCDFNALLHKSIVIKILNVSNLYWELGMQCFFQLMFNLFSASFKGLSYAIRHHVVVEI